jgi:predicted helicase
VAAFTADYYGKEDYKENLAKDLPTIYHVEDNWENYEKISRQLTECYQGWKKAGAHA